MHRDHLLSWMRDLFALYRQMAVIARAMGVPDEEIDRITAEYEARKRPEVG